MFTLCAESSSKVNADLNNRLKPVRMNLLQMLTLPPKVLRSSIMFNWKCDCFLCGESAKVDNRHPDKWVVRSAQTLPLQQ